MDKYSALTQLVTNAEAITWNRFYNFLMGNSILILAWTTVYTGTSNPPMENMILISISIFGVITSPLWAALGSRGRKFLHEFVEMAVAMENDERLRNANYLTYEYKPFNKIKSLKEKLPWKKAGSFFLLTAIPWAFTILFLILFHVSITK